MPLKELTSIEQVKSQAINQFTKHFKTTPKVISVAPGRVNLIGGHIDYNDGYVLPITIPLVTVVVGSPSHNDHSSVITLSTDVDAPHIIECSDLSQWLVPATPKWANYIKGVLVNFKDKILPFNAVISTSVPIGGGLSSSASIEVSFYLFLEKMFGPLENDQTLLSRALICQKAEHVYAGTPCGIMDQLVSFSGQNGNVIFIDCLTHEFKRIPFPTQNIVILVINSNVKHDLATSEYAVRRSQCKEALYIMGITSYRQVKSDNLELLNDHLILKKRARHVVSEISRCLESLEALKMGDLRKLGSLLCESHRSLKDDYEVSCKELDSLKDIVCSFEGVYGARMTGGGFGGSVVAIVHSDVVNKVVEGIDNMYDGMATIMKVTPSDGAY